MTIEEAREEIPDIEVFCKNVCLACKEEWFCRGFCNGLIKARQMDFSKILRSYARNEGDIVKVCRYINRA